MNNEGNKEWVSIRMKKNGWAGKRTEIYIVEIWMWYTQLETSGKFCLKETQTERTLKNTPGEGSHSCLVHQVDTQGTPHSEWEHINPRFFSQLSQLISITWSQNSRTPALWVPKSPYSNLQFKQCQDFAIHVTYVSYAHTPLYERLVTKFLGFIFRHSLLAPGWVCFTFLRV